MVLRDYDGVWYFSSVSRDGSSLSVANEEAGDMGIVSTLVSEQAANQALVSGIIDGSYKSAAIDSVSTGSGTATVHITIGGGTAPTTAGSIVCVSKVIDGEKCWFVTSFTKN